MWDNKYSGEEFLYGVEPNDFLLANHQRLTGCRVLCLAEGEGRNAVFLARQGCAVTAVDSSVVGLNKGRRLARHNGVEVDFIHQGLDEYDMGTGQWDGIVSIFCHLPEPLRASLHRRVVAGLDDGGVFLLEAFTPDQLAYGTGGPPSADLMMTAESLRRELAGLQFEHLAELERPVLEGTGHTGLAAVVQAVAFRRPEV